MGIMFKEDENVRVGEIKVKAVTIKGRSAGQSRRGRKARLSDWQRSKHWGSKRSHVDQFQKERIRETHQLLSRRLNIL